MNYASKYAIYRVTLWRSWLRHWAASRKVAGSIPDFVTGIFHRHNPSGRTLTLGLTQPVAEMGTTNISYVVKAACVWGWKPYPLHEPIVFKCGSLNLLETSGPVQSCNRITLPTYIYIYIYIYIYTHTLSHTNTTGADKSLARPGRKQARKRVRDAPDFN